MAAGDLDGDNWPDLAVTNEDELTVSVLLNKCDGTFAPAVDYECGVQPHCVAIHDLDGDGWSELAVGGGGIDGLVPYVAILTNLGDGTFADAVHYAANGAPEMIIATDLDADGWTDLAIANWATLDVLTNLGDGMFGPPRAFFAGQSPGFVALADLNSDRQLDAALTNRSDDCVTILLGKAGGTFDTADLYTTGEEPFGVVTG